MALECFNKWHIWMVYYDVYIEALAAYFPINIFKNYSDTHFLSYSDLYRKFHGSVSVKDPSDASEIVQYVRLVPKRHINNYLGYCFGLN